jgi:hypothetical protein
MGLSRQPADGPAAISVSEHVTARPAAGLRPYIARYSGYREAGQQPAVHRGLSSPRIPIPPSLPTSTTRWPAACTPHPR